MSVRFKAYGHENIRATHNRTIEFTKHKELSVKGDCIVGVNSDFSSEEIKKLLKFDKLKIVMMVDGLSEEMECIVNKDFCDEEEIVLRIGEFVSDRTLGVRCDKACSDIDREIVEKMKTSGKEMEVVIKGVD